MATVKPLHVRSVPVRPPASDVVALDEPAARKAKGRVPPLRKAAPPPPSPTTTVRNNGGLDGHWDRRLLKGNLHPDMQIDLHGLGLAHAYARLDGVLEQAIASGFRTILLITGKPRGHDRTSGSSRGAIRAAIDDWLHASRHASDIASVRQAHPRHGGEGALYIILRRGR